MKKLVFIMLLILVGVGAYYAWKMLKGDGGDIELVGVDEQTGVVSVRLQGACKGCPGAAMTLKMGVERHLKERVPSVSEVVAVE